MVHLTKNEVIIALKAKIKDLECKLEICESYCEIDYMAVHQRDEKANELGISVADYMNKLPNG